MTQHPFISTRGLREPLEEPAPPTPDEQFQSAMLLLRVYAKAASDDDDITFRVAHEALCNLFMDIYKLDDQ